MSGGRRRRWPATGRRGFTDPRAHLWLSLIVIGRSTICALTTEGKQTQKRIWLLLCLLLAPLSALAGKEIKVDNSVMTMRIDGEIAIDTAGKVLDYKITTPSTPEMQQILDKSVRRWTFQPVVLEGKPVAAKSRMRITLAAREARNGYAVSVDNVTFRGDPGGEAAPSATEGVPVSIATGVMRPPLYPKNLARGGVEAAVLLYLKLSLDGSVEQAIAVQSSLFDVRGSANIVAQARKQFEDSALSAARRWKFAVTARSTTPTASDLTVSVPVQYTMVNHANRDETGSWRVELRSEKNIVPWLVDATDAQDIGISDVDTNDVLSIASAFKLNTDVVGKAL